MNERIKELMWDAGLNSNYIEGFDSIYSKQIEKFAELIVLECIDQFCYRGAVYADSDIVIGVMNHFGVEE